MKTIQMVDLVGQYEKIKPAVDEALMGVMGSAAFIKGPEVKSFQLELQAYLDVKHVIPCANGTDALQIALMALGLEPGDEVITSNFTFAATVEVIGLLRLTPVLIDVERDTFNMDVEALKKAITPNTKAIIPVHIFGQCSNMEAIMQIAKENNIAVVEDTCAIDRFEIYIFRWLSKICWLYWRYGYNFIFPFKKFRMFWRWRSFVYK